MNEYVFVGLEFLMFVVIIFLVANLSFEMGEFSGLKNFCPIGSLVRDTSTDVVTCESKVNSSVVLFNGDEVVFNGS